MNYTIDTLWVLLEHLIDDIQTCCIMILRLHLQGKSFLIIYILEFITLHIFLHSLS